MSSLGLIGLCRKMQDIENERTTEYIYNWVLKDVLQNVDQLYDY